MISRQRFKLQGATGGTWSDTGAPVTGILERLRYVADTGTDRLDSGANIAVAILAEGVDHNNDHTIGAFTVLSTADLNLINSGGNWEHVPLDTGGATVGRPMVSERLRVTVTQDSGATDVGTLLAYIRD